jgi:hypothetical protein
MDVFHIETDASYPAEPELVELNQGFPSLPAG